MPNVRFKNITNSTLSVLDQMLSPGAIFSGEVNEDLMRVLKQYEGKRISFDVEASVIPKASTVALPPKKEDTVIEKREISSVSVDTPVTTTVVEVEKPVETVEEVPAEVEVPKEEVEVPKEEVEVPKEESPAEEVAETPKAPAKKTASKPRPKATTKK